MVSRENDGMTWKPYNSGTQVLTSGPMAMAYDSTNHIMYSSNLYALLALKVLGSTSVKNQTAPKALRAHSSELVGKTFTNHLGVIRKTSANGVKSELFDVRGQRLRVIFK